MYAMWAVHCLSALVSLAHMCVFFMLDAYMTTGSSIRAVICRRVASYFIFRLSTFYRSVMQ